MTRNKSTFNYNEKNISKVLETQVTEITLCNLISHNFIISYKYLNEEINQVHLPYHATIKAAIWLQGLFYL